MIPCPKDLQNADPKFTEVYNKWVEGLNLSEDDLSYVFNELLNYIGK